ncbi:hypothetical protein Patl1_25438 [Pistacia atlantica]|uniref:Uncharacterized protein n=1 Tax=Pistacia atlantica TaxID=434234 RepID=A0ACC1B101_9ROSI|nr:hypothetical protein Patl1_25438 [Pistacia atlantica]
MLIKYGVNSGFTSLCSAKNRMWVSSSVLRRQRFLIRTLGGNGDHINTNHKTMQAIRAMSRAALEADSENILRAITPTLDPTRHKGQAGKIAVIGGCREYTGAPYFAAISALKIVGALLCIFYCSVSSFSWFRARIGADLSHVFCTKDAAPVIKSYSPELIVHPILEESYSISGLSDEERRYISSKILAEVDKWMERFDCLVVGPGLGRDPYLLECVSEILKHARQSKVPIVIDGLYGIYLRHFATDHAGISQDGLFLVTNSLDLVSGYPLAVLTPNVNEYKRLVQRVLGCEVNDEDAPEQLQSLVKGIGGVTILQKGKSDLISNGEIVKSVSIYGSPRRCGGQGDILSGKFTDDIHFLFIVFGASVAVFLSWARAKQKSSISPTNPTVLGCIAGSALVRKAASLAFEHKKRSTLTSDIIECLGKRQFGGYLSSLLIE